MGYVGNKPALNYTTFAVQHFTTSATTGYTLDHAVTNENDIRLVINNVVQQPGGSYAYTATGTVLTLSAATTGSDTMYCVFIGKAVQTVNPGAASVGTSQLATDAVTTVKITDTNVTGAKLNDDVISGQGALGAEPADTDEFLVSDAGVLKRVDYSYIKPTAQVFLPNVEPLIINGNMAVAQRGTSTTGITGGGFYTVDRWDFDNSAGGGAASTWTQTQESLTSGDAFVDGFRNSIKMDVTTAAGTLAAGSNANIHQTIEAQNLQCLKFGGASAETFTVAFWVKATKTGTYILEGHLSDDGRACSQAYTVSSSDTWEYKILNFPADTTGVIDNNNGSGMQLFWWLAAGTTFTSGTLSTTWTADTAANRAVGQVNASDSTSNNFEIAGVQMEVGTYTSSTLPPFRHESYGDNLLRCQRYYQNNYRDGLYPGDSTTDAGSWSGQLYSTDFLTTFSTWTVRMRTNPTITWYTRTGTAGSWYAGVYQVNEAVDTMTTSINTPTGWNGTVSNVAATTNIAYGYYSAQAEL